MTRYISGAFFKHDHHYEARLINDFFTSCIVEAPGIFTLMYCFVRPIEQTSLNVTSDVGVLSTWTTWTCEDSCGYTKEFRNRTCDDNPDYDYYLYRECPPSCDGELWEEVECDAGCCGSE